MVNGVWPLIRSLKTMGMKVSRSSQPFDAICIKDFRGKHVHNIASSQDILRRLLPDFTVQFYDAIRKTRAVHISHFTFPNSPAALRCVAFAFAFGFIGTWATRYMGWLSECEDRDRATCTITGHYIKLRILCISAKSIMKDASGFPSSTRLLSL